MRPALESALQRWFELDFTSTSDPDFLSLPPALKGGGPDSCEALHAACAAAGDANGASAAVVAAVVSIWAEGRDFTAFAPWIRRIDELLGQSFALHPVVVAALAQNRLIAGMLGTRPIDELQQFLPVARRAADDSRSLSLRIVCIALEGALHVLSGDLHRAEECLRDAMPLAARLGEAPIPLLYLANCAAMIEAARGTHATTRDVLDARMFDSTLLRNLPVPLVLLIRCHRLLILARHATEAVVEAAAADLRALVIPPADRHLIAYLHFALGVAALLHGRPAQALDHARISGQYGAWCGSTLTQALPALLEAQSLADLKQDDAALGMLDDWLPRWEAAGYRLVRAAALLECASLHLRAGRVAAARRAGMLARAALPPGATLPDYHRPPGFAARLEWSLLPPVAAPSSRDGPEVRIATFGDLRVSVGDQIVFDRDWHGSRTKRVLKALIVLGGRKVSLERLCDLVWPDADGDHARQNLKVALSRLRHVGVPQDVLPLPWIVTVHGQVSLVSSLCRVDAIEFHERLVHAGRNDRAGLTAALDLYGADFLANDDSAPWIVAHRDLLRRQYVQTAHAVARDCLAASLTDVAEPYLERAIDIEPLDERSYALLIDLQRLAGNDAGAQATQKRANGALQGRTA